MESRCGDRARQAPVVYSVGHSTRPTDVFVGMLREAGVTRLADVRRIPRSARHPQFNADRLAQSLAEAGIDYRHLVALGGRRHAPKHRVSRNTLWRVESFRNYADYAETPEFASALNELEGLAREQPTAFMCAELCGGAATAVSLPITCSRGAGGSSICSRLVSRRRHP